MTKLEKAIEACWLSGAALVPLAMVPQSWATGFIEGPKIFVVRTVALLLAVLLSVEWARRPRSVTANADNADTISLNQAHRSLSSALQYLSSQPIAIAAAAVAAVTVISTAFSPLLSISFFGVDPGRDSYALLSIASYLVIFGAIGAHLKSVDQIRRLIWVLTASSIILSTYGIGQHFGIDPFRKDVSPALRISLTFGNAVFGAAYLLMVIPLTLALWQAWRNTYGFLAHVAIGAGLIATPMTAVAFTLSRGSIISLLVAIVVFLGVIGLVMGVKAAGRPAASIAIAVSIAFAMGYVPVTGSIEETGQLVTRLSTVGGEVTYTGGLSDRYTTWVVAAQSYIDVPWIDTSQYSGMPSLTLPILRPIIGYGPDMFTYAYALQGDTTHFSLPAHAHNFIIHTAIELGLLGVIAYAALAIATGLTLILMLLAARRGETSQWMAYIIFGLIGVFAGRLLEQMAGKGQVADITLAWILAGVVLAMSQFPASQWIEPLPAAPNLATLSSQKRAPKSRSSMSPSRASRSSAKPGLPMRAALVVVVAILTLVFWWHTVFLGLYVTFLSAKAISASDAGDFSAAGAHLMQSVERFPSSTSQRTILGKSLLAGARLEADTHNRLAQLQEALRVIKGITDRNPLDYRAWTIASDITRELLFLDKAFAAEAISTHETTAALSPGLRQPAEQLATIFLIAGDYRQALEIVLSARDLAALDDPEGHFLSYIEAEALLGMGNMEEANAIALMLSESGNPDAIAWIKALEN